LKQFTLAELRKIQPVIMFIVGWLVLEGASPVTLNKKLSFKLVVEPASVYTNKQDVPCQAELFQVLKITF
jgi:hypothetical protein